MTGSQALRLNLHQTFATPDGLILLRFCLVAKLTLFAAPLRAGEFLRIEVHGFLGRGPCEFHPYAS